MEQSFLPIWMSTAEIAVIASIIAMWIAILIVMRIVNEKVDTDISRLKAIKIIARTLIVSYKETVKGYWSVMYNTLKGIFELMIMSVLVIICTIFVTFIFLIATFVSLISKTLRNEIKSDYLEESGSESNKSEGEIAERYLFGDEEL